MKQRWAVIPKADDRKWHGVVLVIRNDGGQPGRYLCSIPGERSGIYLSKDEIRIFDDFDKAERFVKALKLFG